MNTVDLIALFQEVAIPAIQVACVFGLGTVIVNIFLSGAFGGRFHL